MLDQPYINCRGECFQTDYGRLGEIRALLPTSVNVMALTATATQVSRIKIIDSLHMQNPLLIYNNLPTRRTFSIVSD